MKIIKVDQNNLKESVLEAAKVLQDGGLVIYPTETVYGIGADAYNSFAVSKLLKYKNRPAGKAVSVMVASEDDANKEVEINATAKNIYTAMLPGPVTVISKVKPNSKVDSRLFSELNTLGIRLSSHEVAMSLAKSYPFPITATSANAAGKSRPYSIDKVLAGLTEDQKKLVDLVLDYGELPHRDPSTVIDTTNEVQTVLRGGEMYAALTEPHISKSEEHTMAIAAEIMASFLHHLTDFPVIFAMEGEMGSGKTHFAKGIARKLGVKKVVTSPTYNLIKEYKGAVLCDLNGCTEEIGKNEVNFVHLDCWRVDQISPEEIDFEQYLKPGTVVVVEWAAPLLAYLEQITDRSKIFYLNVDSLGDNKRKIEVKKVNND